MPWQAPSCMSTPRRMPGRLLALRRGPSCALRPRRWPRCVSGAGRLPGCPLAQRRWLRCVPAPRRRGGRKQAGRRGGGGAAGPNGRSWVLMPVWGPGCVSAPRRAGRQPVGSAEGTQLRAAAAGVSPATCRRRGGGAAANRRGGGGAPLRWRGGGGALLRWRGGGGAVVRRLAGGAVLAWQRRGWAGSGGRGCGLVVQVSLHCFSCGLGLQGGAARPAGVPAGARWILAAGRGRRWGAGCAWKVWGSLSRQHRAVRPADIADGILQGQAALLG